MLEKIFVPSSFFLLRIPIWPIDKFGSINNNLESYQRIFLENEQLREAIAIASPNLYESLKKVDSKNVKQEIQSLSHYISRMMTRATPFGLFSSVSLGKWGDTTSIDFNDQSLKKQARFDMEWVFLLIRRLYQDEKKIFSLPVRTNPLLYFSGERYYLDYLRHTREADKELSSPSLSTSKSIRVTQLTQLILEYAREGILVDQLWLKLQSSLPILEKDKTLAVILQLFSQQFLLPGLLPSLLSSFPFEFLKQDHLFPCLKVIFEEIKAYNQLPPGKGEKALENLQGSMSAIVHNKSYLQVDTAYAGEKIELSKILLEELEKALNFLWKIANIQKSSNNLTTYHLKFLEKYGEFRTVPLLDLLDEEKGLGPLFENPIAPISNPEWEKWVHHQWQDCLFHKKKEWVLTEESIESFMMLSKQKINPVDAPLSLDLLCKVFADSQQNIDLGKFLLVISEITKEGGSILGRFLDLLGHETQDKIAQLFALEEQLEKQSIFVELSYLPAAVRNANVALHPCLRNHSLDLEANYSQEGAFALRDIYVGATNSKFYLTDKENRFNIITRANHLLHTYYDPLPLKFMRHVTRSQYSSISVFSWGSLQEKAVFLPRVRLGNTIFSLATWNIDSQPYLKESSKNISTFMAWAAQWDLPLSFFMVDGDQYLLFDRSNPNHVNEIICKLRKGESLKFIERLEGAWIKGTDGNHACEISVPFIKNIKYARKENPIKAFPYSQNWNDNREKFPGSNWLYLKLYIGKEKIDEFLISHLYNFIGNFSQEGTIKEWFFIRYSDPESHLRLRIHADAYEMIAKVLCAFEKQLRLWTHLGWIKDVAITKYEREIERYGGLSLIEAAETLFYHDSLSIIFTLHAFLTNQIPCEKVVFHALSVVAFLQNFGLDINQMLSILNNLVTDESELKGFRQHKLQLFSLINALLNDSNEILEIQVINAVSQMRSQCMMHYCNSATHLEKERWNSIIASLLHMHCNRLGCLGKAETQAKLYARHTLLSILNKEAARLSLTISQTVLKK